jgi:hypothetical protein
MSQYTPSRQTGPIVPQNPTTSFLTATTLIYAIGAGITAAAGTRLALQLFLVKGFKLYSFQLRDPCRDPYCYLLSLPRRIAIGEFARLLPSLEVVAIFKAPSPESNPNSPSPVTTMVVHYTTIES